MLAVSRASACYNPFVAPRRKGERRAKGTSAMKNTIFAVGTFLGFWLPFRRIERVPTTSA